MNRAIYSLIVREASQRRAMDVATITIGVAAALLLSWVAWSIGCAVGTALAWGMKLMDWDEIMALAAGFAAVGYIIVDQKRERRLDDLAVEHAERIARLEANSDDSVALEARLVALEAAAERDGRLEERMSGYAERIAIVETRIPVSLEERLAGIGERVAALETKADTTEESEDADG